MEIPELVQGDDHPDQHAAGLRPPRSPTRPSATCSPSRAAWPTSSASSRARSGGAPARASSSTSWRARRCWSSAWAGSAARSPAAPSAFGMRVLATDPKVLERPLFVEELHRPDAFHALLPRADVVASAVPLTQGVAEDDRRGGVRADEAGRHPDQRLARRGGRHRRPGRRPGQQARRRRRARRDRPGAAAQGAPALVAERDHHAPHAPASRPAAIAAATRSSARTSAASPRARCC